jgi:hypothetical protein
MNRLLKRLFYIGSMILILELAAACSTTYHVPRPAPPPPRKELRARRPHRKAVWVPGHWRWRGRRKGYVWIAGHWKIVR